VIEHLPSKCEALSQNPRTAKKKKKEGMKGPEKATLEKSKRKLRHVEVRG
jgi:hypothetical protein